MQIISFYISKHSKAIIVKRKAHEEKLLDEPPCFQDQLIGHRLTSLFSKNMKKHIYMPNWTMVVVWLWDMISQDDRYYPNEGILCEW